MGGRIFKGFLNISYPSQLVESTLTVQPTILHHLLLPCTIHHDKKNWAPWPGGPPHRLAKDFQLVQVPQESEVCQHFQPVWLYSKIITNIKETPPDPVMLQMPNELQGPLQLSCSFFLRME